MKKLFGAILISLSLMASSSHGSDFATRTFSNIASHINSHKDYYLLGLTLAAYYTLPMADAAKNFCDMCPETLSMDEVLQIAEDLYSSQHRLQLIEGRILTKSADDIIQQLLSKDELLLLLTQFREALDEHATCAMEMVRGNVYDCAYLMPSLPEAAEQFFLTLGVFLYPHLGRDDL